MGDDRHEDPIASALLGGSQYERLRVQRYSMFKQSIPRKLALQGVILTALALVLPLATTLPASARAMFPGGAPLTSAPKILLLGAYAGALETVAVGGLVYVGYRRIRRGDALSEHEAEHLLTVEDVASMISLVTGLVAVAVVDGFFLLGHAGEEAMAAFLAAGGRNPFAAASVPVTVVDVATAAGVLAVVAFGLSWLFTRHLPSS